MAMRNTRAWMSTPRVVSGMTALWPAVARCGALGVLLTMYVPGVAAAPTASGVVATRAMAAGHAPAASAIHRPAFGAALLAAASASAVGRDSAESPAGTPL